MSQDLGYDTRAIPQVVSTTAPSLFDLLHNSLVLRNVAPYLPLSCLLKLASSDKGLRSIILNTPGVFRHLDLTRVKSAQFDIEPIDTGGEIWRNVQLDENLTEDDFYSGPLRGALSSLRRHNILQDVQTLVLDGLSVTSDVCHELINDPTFNVRILSIREVKNLNQAKLRGSLQYACRSTRPPNTPRLKALYVFGHKDSKPMAAAPSGGSTSASPTSISTGWNLKSHEALSSSLRWEDESWWLREGPVVTRPISQDWVNCMAACQGLIAFDAMLCQGPRHRTSPAFGKPSMMTDNQPQVATHSIRGCESCGTAPEGLVSFDATSAQCLPLLTPPPLLSSSILAATTPSSASPQPFLPRCMDCLRERYCTSCNKWWCEICYQLPGQGAQPEIGNFVVVGEDDGANTMTETMDFHSTTPKLKTLLSKSCWECGTNCEACITKTQRSCQKCHAGYCITHNEGSSAEFCDWCVSRGRGLGRQDSKSAGRIVVSSSGIPLSLARRRVRDALTRPLL